MTALDIGIVGLFEMADGRSMLLEPQLRELLRMRCAQGPITLSRSASKVKLKRPQNCCSCSLVSVASVLEIRSAVTYKS